MVMEEQNGMGKRDIDKQTVKKAQAQIKKKVLLKYKSKEGSPLRADRPPAELTKQ